MYQTVWHFGKMHTYIHTLLLQLSIILTLILSNRKNIVPSIAIHPQCNYHQKRKSDMYMSISI